jgi:hypothetical protein
MKLKHVLIAGLCTVLFAAASCKKEDKEKPKTTAERIQAKWSIQNIILHGHSNGTDSTITLPALTTDYFDIRSDNKIYTNFYHTMDTLDYVLQDDSTLIIKDYGYFQPDASYKIRTLTDNSLTLYTLENDPANQGDFIEETDNFKK